MRLEFDDLDPNRCPLCGCPSLEFTDYERGMSNKIFVELKCKDCGATWGLQFTGVLDAFIDIRDMGDNVVEDWVE